MEILIKVLSIPFMLAALGLVLLFWGGLAWLLISTVILLFTAPISGLAMLGIVIIVLAIMYIVGMGAI